MTERQKRIVELTKQTEKLSKEQQALWGELNYLLEQEGQGTMFQDEEDGTVFRVTIPRGTYIEYKQIAYERTRRNGEKKGSLSLEDAKAAGFSLPGKAT